MLSQHKGEAQGFQHLNYILKGPKGSVLPIKELGSNFYFVHRDTYNCHTCTSVNRIRRPSSVCSSTISNDFSSETAWPIKAKFHVEPPWVGELKFVRSILVT